MSRAERQFLREMKRSVRECGTAFNTVRPDYTSSTSSETTTGTGVLFRAEPISSKWGKPRITGVEYFEVWGSVDSLRSGDILKKSTFNPNMPILTIEQVGVSTAQNGMKLEPTVGIVTNSIGKITDGDAATGTIYDNVRFNFIVIPSVGEGFDQKVLGSLGIGIRRVIMYERNGIVPGMWLRWDETGLNGATIKHKLRIDVIDRRSPLMILNVSDKKAGT